MIGLINYGSGNINAIANIYNRLNIDFTFINSAEDIDKADKLILPGVGDFDETMTLLSQMNIIDPLNDYVVKRSIPILGVCVGMQILGESSEEGSLAGLGWIKGSVKKMNESAILEKPYLPHMGWNSVDIKREHQLFDGIDTSDGFYFLHSYHFDCMDNNDILCTSRYGIEFTAAINRNNVYGMQFHPEKSHANGIRLFKNFANLK